MSENLMQIVYISSAEHPFSTEELESFLAKIRAKNKANGITGMLLYKDGDFIQAIEGKEDVVCPLFEKISKANEHYGVTELMRKRINSRQFGDWSMGFHHPESDDPKLKGFNDFFSDRPDYNVDGGDALNLLLVFRE